VTEYEVIVVMTAKHDEDGDEGEGAGISRPASKGGGGEKESRAALWRRPGEEITGSPVRADPHTPDQ